MTKKLFLFLLLLPATVFAKVPGPIKPGIEKELDVRAFYRVSDFNFLLEYIRRHEVDSRVFKSIRIGPYYRVHPNLKIGAFYAAHMDVRHDEDWIQDPNLKWTWADTRTRGESILVLDATPRYKMSFLPGKNWVFELKNRYLYSFFNGNQTLKVRPGIRYFWMRDSKPFLSFFLRYELYIPVNYGVKSIYETWAYLGGLYHVTPVFNVGAFGALRKVTWGSTDHFKSKTGQTFETSVKTTVIGLMLGFNLSEIN